MENNKNRTRKRRKTKYANGKQENKETRIQGNNETRKHGNKKTKTTRTQEHQNKKK